MGVKTRQAYRTVLNNLRDEVNNQVQNGLLEEAEGFEITGVIKIFMLMMIFNVTANIIVIIILWCYIVGGC